jgi:hypothetical protein
MSSFSPPSVGRVYDLRAPSWDAYGVTRPTNPFPLLLFSDIRGRPPAAHEVGFLSPSSFRPPPPPPSLSISYPPLPQWTLYTRCRSSPPHATSKTGCSHFPHLSVRPRFVPGLLLTDSTCVCLLYVVCVTGKKMNMSNRGGLGAWA